MKKWITKALLALAGLGVLAFFAGCYPDNTLTPSQSDVVMTGYNDSVNFQSLHTYYMPDTILVRRSDTTDKTPVQYQKAYLAEFLLWKGPMLLVVGTIPVIRAGAIPHGVIPAGAGVGDGDGIIPPRIISLFHGIRNIKPVHC